MEEKVTSKPPVPTKKPDQPLLPYVYMGSDGNPSGKLSDSSWKSRSMDALHVPLVSDYWLLLPWYKSSFDFSVSSTYLAGAPRIAI